MMKPLLIAGLLLAAGTAAAKAPAHHAHQPPPPPADFSGGWDTDWGLMSIDQTDTHLQGSFTRNHGRMTAEVKGNVAEGYWSESTGGTRCATMKLGSPYWGRLELIAQPGGRAFVAHWSFCDGPPGTELDGKRR